MKYNPMDPQETSQLDIAHEELEDGIQKCRNKYGVDDTEEALVCAIVMCGFLDAASIRDRLNAHLALDEAFADNGIEEGEDHDDWDELQAPDKPNPFADDLGGRFDD